ncbi:MAG: MFS transporter [Candidatus Omnitrophica bacterium]|nr:MFS transporter [Candidatus Omnitrophota bacterium]MDD5435983.1 MFS transporter [Candidatus Omnitrophota bacterium]
MTRFRDVLRNKNFFFLWLGQLISNFGDRLNQMALVALVYQRNPGSEIALAKLISFTIIPVFLVGPIAGAWVDRLNRRKIMLISDILRGLLVLSIPLFIKANQILLVYLAIFLTFSISRFFIPSKMALIPELVPKEKLLVANALSDTTHMIGNVVGLVVAGVIVNIVFIGAIGGFYIDSATFFISAALIAMIVQRGFVRDVKDDLAITGKALENSLRRNIFSEIREGFRYLIKYSDMRFVVYVFFLLMAGVGAISCVIIVFIQSAFGTSTRDLGFLGLFLVGGLLLGSILYGRFCQRIPKKKAIHLSFAASGIAIILFTLVVNRYPNLLLGGVLVGLLGFTISPIMVTTNTLAHETIPQDARGRIFSSLEAVIHLAFLVFMFIAAYAAKYVEGFWIIVTVGLVYFVCGIARLATSSKNLSLS